MQISLYASISGQKPTESNIDQQLYLIVLVQTSFLVVCWQLSRRTWRIWGLCDSDWCKASSGCFPLSSWRCYRRTRRRSGRRCSEMGRDSSAARFGRETRTDLGVSDVSVPSAMTAAVSADLDQPLASWDSLRCSACAEETVSGAQSAVVEERVAEVEVESCCHREADVSPCRQPRICIIVWYNIFYTCKIIEWVHKRPKRTNEVEWITPLVV